MPYKDPAVNLAEGTRRALKSYYAKREDPEYRAKRKAYAAKYRQANKEKIKAGRALDRERARERAKSWYAINKDKPEVKARRQAYRLEYASRPDVKVREKAYRESHRQDQHRYHFQYRLAKYGLTVEDFARLYESQGRKCRTCLTDLLLDRKTHIDHCHQSGQVRGLLCESCNVALGHLKDNTTTAAKLIAYLTK